jgi:Abnormal spindle-like microcephaly-assoc'd, ASPM-SPD-2-Hydin
VTPTSLAFGNVVVGTTSSAQTLTLSNTGTATLSGIGVAVTAPYSRPAGAAGGTCGATLPAGATCTVNVVFTPTVAAPATGTVTITASVGVTGSPVALTGTGLAPPTIPTLTVLDNFDRGNATNLNVGAPAGVSWSQTTTPLSVIRVNSNQANCVLPGNCALGTAIWNGTTNVFGPKQGAAITFTSTPAAGLYLKASGGSPSAPASFIRVRPGLVVPNQIIVETTTNSGGTLTTRGTFAATLVSGDRLTAVANADGSVDVWKTTASVTTYLGHSSAVAAFTGTGRIGMGLVLTASVDDFAGGTVP